MFKCDICHKAFISKTRLHYHLFTHTTGTHVSGSSVQCDICRKIFTQSSYLKLHMLIHGGETAYKCDICQKRFVRKPEYFEHLRTHTGEQPYQCGTCQKRFASKQGLSYHVELHKNQKEFKCETCGKDFGGMWTYKSHMKKSHQKDVCQRGLVRKKYFVQLRTRTREKIYQCGTCEKRFTSKPALHYHVELHKNEKDFKCERCGKDFGGVSTWRAHMKNSHKVDDAVFVKKEFPSVL